MRQVLVVAAVLGAALPARADDTAPPPPTPFDRGKLGLSAGAGSQTALGTRYIVVGGSVSYFVLDGVAIGLSALHEFGDGPSISKVSPELRYVAQPLVGTWPVIPYVGTFYTHWFIGDPYADIDAIGARAGLMFISGQVLLGLGVAVEHQVSACTMDCNAIFPDIAIGLAL